MARQREAGSGGVGGRGTPTHRDADQAETDDQHRPARRLGDPGDDLGSGQRRVVNLVIVDEARGGLEGSKRKIILEKVEDTADDGEI